MTYNEIKCGQIVRSINNPVEKYTVTKKAHGWVTVRPHSALDLRFKCRARILQDCGDD